MQQEGQALLATERVTQALLIDNLIAVKFEQSL